MEEEIAFEAEKYLNWLQHISMEGAEALTFEDLFNQLSDGIIVLKVVETLRHSSVDWTKVNNPASNMFKKMDNWGVVSHQFQSLGLAETSVKAKELVRADPDTMIGVLWLLMRQYFIDVNGAKDEAEILALAKQFEKQKNETIIYGEYEDRPSIELIFYYGEEGEVFCTFADDDELDCPKVPLDFDQLLSKPMEPVFPMHAKLHLAKNPSNEAQQVQSSQSNQQIQSPSNSRLNQKTLRSRPHKRVIQAENDENADLDKPNKVDTEIVMTNDKPSHMAADSDNEDDLFLIQKSMIQPKEKSQNPIKEGKTEKTTEKKDAIPKPEEPKKEVWHEANKMKADEGDEIELFEFEKPVFSRQTSNYSSSQDQFQSQKGLDEDPLYQEPDLNSLAFESRVFSKDSDLSLEKKLSAQSGRSATSSENPTSPGPRQPEYFRANSLATEKSDVDLKSLKNLNKNVWLNSPYCQADSNLDQHEEVTSGDRIQQMKDNKNLFVSEVFEECERPSEDYHFSGYATILNSISKLRKERFVHVKQNYNRFKVGQEKPQLVYYLRLEERFGNELLLKFTKVHSKFPGYNYEKLYQHSMMNSEYVSETLEKKDFISKASQLQKKSSQVSEKLQTVLTQLSLSANSEDKTGINAKTFNEQVLDQDDWKKHLTLKERLLAKRHARLTVAKKESDLMPKRNRMRIQKVENPICDYILPSEKNGSSPLDRISLRKLASFCEVGARYRLCLLRDPSKPYPLKRPKVGGFLSKYVAYSVIQGAEIPSNKKIKNIDEQMVKQYFKEVFHDRV